MIRNPEKVIRFEMDLLRKEPIDIARNFALVHSLWLEARALKVFPPSNPLEGIEIDLKIARVVNYVPTTPPKNGSCS